MSYHEISRPIIIAIRNARKKIMVSPPVMDRSVNKFDRNSKGILGGVGNRAVML